MVVDLSGGLAPQFEHFLAGQPDEAGMRDSATLWIMDERGQVAFPRVTIDAIGAHWERPWAQLNMVLRDGRTFRIWDKLPGSSGGSPPARRGAGGLVFECLEPFRLWSMTFDGTVQQSTSALQMKGAKGGRDVALAFGFVAEMAEAPWVMGGMTAEAANAMTSTGGQLMGGLRYEQLCRVAGWVQVDGERHDVSGAGMRVRRRGVRSMGGAPGHCQHSALFPSGRAFGANAFWPAADGSQPFNEAFLVTADGERLPARLAEAPWMTRLEGPGDRIPLLFETPAGRIRIEGQTLLKVFDHHDFEMADTSVLEQGTARYVWDGEEAIGLFERCTLRGRIAEIDAKTAGARS